MVVLALIILATASVTAINIWWLDQPTVEGPGSRVDINTATLSELTRLPEIDLSTAERLISERPYTEKDDLVQKHIISQTTYDEIEDQIVAKQQ